MAVKIQEEEMTIHETLTLRHMPFEYMSIDVKVLELLDLELNKCCSEGVSRIR